MSYSNYYKSSGLFHGSLSAIMGTQLDVLLFGAYPDRLSRLWEELVADVRRLEGMLNRFSPDSEISRLNRDARQAPVLLSDEMWRIVVDCKRYYIQTDGFFDITLRDFNAVFLSASDKSVFFTEGNLSFDFGGYAKGYALKHMRQLIAREGLERALVNFGNSSVLAVGTHPRGESWKVGIDNPYIPGKQIGQVELRDTSLSTSGNMPSHPRHILNPFTGEYVTERKMVSVVAGDPVDAEVLTTVLMIAGADKIPGIVSKFNIKEKHMYIL